MEWNTHAAEGRRKIRNYPLDRSLSLSRSRDFQLARRGLYKYNKARAVNAIDRFAPPPVWNVSSNRRHSQGGSSSRNDIISRPTCASLFAELLRWKLDVLCTRYVIAIFERSVQPDDKAREILRDAKTKSKDASAKGRF